MHIGGLITPAIDEIAALCAAAGVHLVEDAAHAHGSAFDGRVGRERSARRRASPSTPRRSSRAARAG